MAIVPLIINGKDIILDEASSNTKAFGFQGATPDLAVDAVESCAAAFVSWSQTSAQTRRDLLLKLAQIAESRFDEIKKTAQDEIHCDERWAEIMTEGGIELIRETASQITSALCGLIPVTVANSYGLVFKEPLGVVLGIAPWNAPVILGLRAVIGPIAAGNTAVLKGSELSPRTHHLLASLFRDAGFPPGVVNFVLHTPEDAVNIYETIINHKAVKKCNFTGSTQVGRSIAAKASHALKPVLLELGGKNFAIVLDDADIDLAAQQILQGAFLNNGQICMSTDLVIVSRSISSNVESKLLLMLRDIKTSCHLISLTAKQKIQRLIADAESKGATVHTAPVPVSSSDQEMPPAIMSGITFNMEFFETESFGPLLGILIVEREEDIQAITQRFSYGLSSAIFSRNHHRALSLAKTLNSGAVHINSMTVHDEATLPHGGWGDSGWGRFGSRWGLEEFLQTKSVVFHP